ncbi:HNH endonuclease [Streptomyces sp. NPDC058655]|uniref:HNH endonuclease n=1 Tax=Streptomyces sp. NPDC058655 TaxID=3346577 RepID=UPI00365B2519
MTQAMNTAVAGTASQWLLQPIGGRALKGPQHYAHSIERGIDLTDPEYGALLGDEAEELHALFRGRPARFWGSTRAESKSHAKNKAIDDTRPGDEVLFISDGSVIARATVVLSFRNRALAEKIWGLDEQQRKAWEYMIAVDDVAVLSRPVKHVTEALGWKKDFVQSLIRQTGDKAHRIHALLNMEQPAVPVPRRADRGRLTHDGLLQAMKTLKTNTKPEGPARHKPLALLWAVGRLTAGQERLAPWGEFEDEVGALLAEFGGKDDRRTPEYPFWHLRTSGLWEVQGVTDASFKPSPTALRRAMARAGFSSDAAHLLKKPRTRAHAVALLLAGHLGHTDVDRAALLERTGLGGYMSASGQDGGDPAASSPVGRRSRTVSALDRDRDLPSLVKSLHSHECQVCREPLETRDGRYSEAAHIQGLGSPHFGTDTLDNLLCLCPNHHRQFDKFGIYIAEDWSVHLTTTGEPKWKLTILPEHRINPEYVAYHRELCLRSW